MRMRRKRSEAHSNLIKTKAERKEAHKCGKCLWAKWSDEERATCMFARCFKDISEQRYTKREGI